MGGEIEVAVVFDVSDLKEKVEAFVQARNVGLEPKIDKVFAEQLDYVIDCLNKYWCDVKSHLVTLNESDLTVTVEVSADETYSFSYYDFGNSVIEGNDKIKTFNALLISALGGILKIEMLDPYEATLKTKVKVSHVAMIKEKGKVND